MEMSLGDFYRKHLDQDKFPQLKKCMASKMALLGSTYVSEQFFLKLGFIKFLYRSVLTNELCRMDSGLPADQLKWIWIGWLGKQASFKALIKAILTIFT